MAYTPTVHGSIAFKQNNPNQNYHQSNPARDQRMTKQHKGSTERGKNYDQTPKARQATFNMFYRGSYQYVGSKNKSQENWSTIKKIYQIGTLFCNLASKANLSAISFDD